ncbi:MAG: 4-hydroxy-tetrahydrodipicolinate synthase [Synergistaceae bacterium]|nr:4-hydroxy-tetrahydrodipicolinate synthase [Synergistaceae bacterium]MBR0081042.1 4-hydroxy-tetrahydrodipicolinate synthase [Synergistaceae bacterium]
MSKSIFKGVATALITPLNSNGVDYDNFAKVIDWQLEQGINALVIAGTTGEGSTLDDAEHKAVVKFAVERINHRCPVIAATGSNDTRYAVQLTKFCCDVGADAMLVVTPYYNKTTQNGLIKMYTTIADASTKPLILYNVPSRTGINIEPETYAVLADHPMIGGIKEANSNIEKIVKTASLVHGKMDIYSGNDDQIVPILSMGGKGVISVLSNPMPKKTMEICDKFFAGDVEGAAKLQCEMLPMINALFCETNPIPVKFAMSKMGFCENYVRLPLVTMEKSHADKLEMLMKEQGLI